MDVFPDDTPLKVRILDSDLVARVKVRSVTPRLVQAQDRMDSFFDEADERYKSVHGEDESYIPFKTLIEKQYLDKGYPQIEYYFGRLDFELEVTEFLKGRDGSVIEAFLDISNYDNDVIAAGSAEDAKSFVQSRHIAFVDERWRNGETEAVVFLYSPNDSTRYGFLGIGFPGSSNYFVPSGGATGTSSSSQYNQEFWVKSADYFYQDLKPPNPLVTGIGLSALKEQIERIEIEVNENNNSENYRDCLRWKWRDEARILEQHANGELYERSDFKVDSGAPSGQVIHQKDGLWTTHTDNIPDLWLEGPDRALFGIEAKNAHLFSNERQPGNATYSQVVSAQRPLPAKTYRFYLNERWGGKSICGDDYHKLLRTANEWFVHVTAPAGALHEAFFDPVALGDAVGADGASGVLKPASFAFDGSDAAIRRIDWLDGQARMSRSPRAALAGHHIDFIALDGSVSLRLDFDDAVEVADDGGGQTLVWGVCSQPWQSGDLLMLRISESAADLAGATFNADCAPSETPASATATPEVTPTETPVPTPTAAPMLTPIPTVSSISAPKAAPTPEQADTVTPTPTP